MSITEDRLQDIPALLAQMTLAEKIQLLAGRDTWNLRAIDRFGVPTIRIMDGPHGLRSTPPAAGGTAGPATAFPCAIAHAAAWRPDLAERLGRAMAKEARERDVDVLLAPCINLHRLPIGGRNFESYSEDPYLTAEMGRAFVKGVQSRGVGTSLKHFACNNQERDRHTLSAEVDERTLREIYLYAFERIVREEQPWTVMGAYNRINGTYACENAYLIRDILRGDWGFDGAFISDWGAVHSDRQALEAGCDLEMPGPGKIFTEERLTALVESGELSEAIIDERVTSVLELIRKCIAGRGPGAANTLEHQRLARTVAEESIVLLRNESRILPLQTERFKKIAVVGALADIPVVGGGGSSLVTPPYAITPLEGICQRFGDELEIVHAPGCTVRQKAGPLPAEQFYAGNEQGFQVNYFNGHKLAGEPVVRRMEREIPLANQFGMDAPVSGVSAESFSIRWQATLRAAASGTYFFTLTTDDKGRISIDGQTVVENWDHPEINIAKSGEVRLEGGREYDFEIIYGKINGPGGIKVECIAPHGEGTVDSAVELAREADAVLLFAGLTESYEHEGGDQPGMALPEGQDKLIEAVCAANPRTIVSLISGTPVAMDAWVEKAAAAVQCWYPGQESGNAIAAVLAGDVNPSGKLPATFPRTFEDAPSATTYPGTDGKVSFDEGIFIGYRGYEKHDITPLFPFGYGLSYTSFDYTGLRVETDDPWHATATVAVRNTGAMSGAEVVQVYVRDVDSTVDRPLKELKGFAKVMLEPGEEKRVTVALDAKAFCFWSVAEGGWTVEPGEFEILVGASSQDIRLRKTVHIIGLNDASN